MKIGSLYRLTDSVKESLNKRSNRFSSKINTLCIRFDDQNDLHTMPEIGYYPVDTLIVPLEVHNTTFDGRGLRGDDSRRLKVLLTDGRIGELFVSLNDWEEVT